MLVKNILKQFWKYIKIKIKHFKVKEQFQNKYKKGWWQNMQFIKEKINMTFTYENYLLRAGTELSIDQGGL